MEHSRSLPDLVHALSQQHMQKTWQNKSGGAPSCSILPLPRTIHDGGAMYIEGLVAAVSCYTIATQHIDYHKAVQTLSVDQIGRTLLLKQLLAVKDLVETVLCSSLSRWGVCRGGLYNALATLQDQGTYIYTPLATTILASLHGSEEGALKSSSALQ